MLLIFNSESIFHSSQNAAIYWTNLSAVATTTGGTSGPELPGVATPLPDHVSASGVSARVARRRAARARTPVDAVDLEKADVSRA